MIVAVTDAGGRMLWVEGDHRLRGAGGRDELRRGRPLGRGGRRHQRPGHRARRRPRRPDLRQRALPPAGAAVELLGRAGARPAHRRAARRDRRDRRRPRGQPARAHAGARHRRRRGVGAALAAPRAGAARGGRPAAPPCPGPRRCWRCSAASAPGCAAPAARWSSRCATPSCCCCWPRPRSRGRAAAPPSWPPSATPGRPRRSPSAPSCPGCAGWSGPTWWARGPTGCSGGSTPTSTRCAGCWPAVRSARRWSATPAPCCPAPARPGVAAARERVAALLRQAVLRSRRPELLLRYAQLPEARDDVAVWQACLEWLPAGSPRRSRGRGAPAPAAAQRHVPR